MAETRSSPHLRVASLNLLAGTLDVTESMMEVGGKLIAGPTKTGRPRTLTLPRFLAELLGEHVKRYPSPDGYVFTMTEAGPIRQRNFYRRHFKPAVLQVGLPAGLWQVNGHFGLPPETEMTPTVATAMWDGCGTGRGRRPRTGAASMTSRSGTRVLLTGGGATIPAARAAGESLPVEARHSS
jgi:hypothetical protein